MRTTLVALLGIAIAATVPGQGTTYIVDAAMGPGANFRDLPAAAAKVSHGDRIIVRKGDYTGFSLDKAVAILGQDGARIAREGVGRVWLTITSIPQGRDVVLQNLEFPLPTPTSAVQSWI